MCALIAIAANLPCLMESCSNFLRPACPYTGCRLSSLTGSEPHGEHSCQLRLLFFLFIDCYQPCLIFNGTDSVSGCCTIFRHRPASDVDAAAATPSLTGFYPRTLADPCIGADSCQDSGTVYMDYVLSVLLMSCLHIYATASFPAAGCFISFIIFSGSYSVPCFRIAKNTLRILQAITISDCIFFNGLSALVV